MRKQADPEQARGQEPTAAARRALVPWPMVVGVLLARAALAVAITLWLAALTPALFGMRLTTVMSDSMAPGLVAGDAVVIRPIAAAQARIGDVLLVDDPDHAGRLRLHRLVEESGGRLVLRGDANRSPDSSTIEAAHVRGVAVARVPFAGLPDYWWRTGRVLPLALFAAVLAVLGALACIDIRPPQGVPLGRRRRISARSRPSGRRRTLGMRALGLAALLVTPVLVATTGSQGWAVFSGIATSSTNTIGANSTFANCPVRPSGVPTPLLYYAFTANAGTTEADLSGSSPAYNGTLANANLRVPAYCDGAVSPYLSLTSSTATAAVVGPSVKATTSFSISFWMNPGTTPSGVLADITDKNGSGAATMTDRQIYYKTDVSPAVLAFGARFGSGNGGLGTPTICTAAAPASGSWHHILATGDVNGVLTLYVDGGQACTVTGTGGYAPGGGSAGGFWSFGAESTLANNWPGSQTTGFVGGLDETAVYGTALSSTDVSTVYAAGH